MSQSKSERKTRENHKRNTGEEILKVRGGNSPWKRKTSDHIAYANLGKSKLVEGAPRFKGFCQSQANKHAANNSKHGLHVGLRPGPHVNNLQSITPNIYGAPFRLDIRPRRLCSPPMLSPQLKSVRQAHKGPSLPKPPVRSSPDPDPLLSLRDATSSNVFRLSVLMAFVTVLSLSWVHFSALSAVVLEGCLVTSLLSRKPLSTHFPLPFLLIKTLPAGISDPDTPEDKPYNGTLCILGTTCKSVMIRFDRHTTVQDILRELRRRRLVASLRLIKYFLYFPPNRAGNLEAHENLMALGVRDLSTLHLRAALVGGAEDPTESNKENLDPASSDVGPSSPRKRKEPASNISGGRSTKRRFYVLPEEHAVDDDEEINRGSDYNPASDQESEADDEEEEYPSSDGDGIVRPRARPKKRKGAGRSKQRKAGKRQRKSHKAIDDSEGASVSSTLHLPLCQ